MPVIDGGGGGSADATVSLDGMRHGVVIMLDALGFKGI
jgi:hypothetical protein